MEPNNKVLFLHQVTSNSGRRTYFESVAQDAWQLPKLFDEYTAAGEPPKFSNFVSWIALHSELKSISIFDRRVAVITDELVWPYKDE